MAIKKKAKKAAKPKKVVKRKIAKKKPAKKAAKKKAVAKKKAAPKKIAGPKAVGQVIHFYGGIKVAVIKFSKDVKKGTAVNFRGATTDFSQKLDSMQYDHKPVAKAAKGKQTGVKVKSRVREGDKVYL